MSASDSSPKRPYASAPVPIDDPLEARRYLERAIESGSKCMLQVKGGEERFQVRIASKSSAAKGMILIPEPGFDLAEFEAALEASGGRQCLVLCFLPGAAILGISAVYVLTDKDRRRGERGQDELVFEYPTRVFKIQRRKEARLDIPRGYDLWVDIPSTEKRNARMKKRLLDLSASGLSFLVLSSREAGFYKTELILPDALITLQGRKMRINLKIRNRVKLLAEGSAESGIKIGASFTQISAEDAEFIMVYVTSRLSHKMM